MVLEKEIETQVEMTEALLFVEDRCGRFLPFRVPVAEIKPIAQPGSKSFAVKGSKHWVKVTYTWE